MVLVNTVRDCRFDYLKAFAITLVFLGHIIMNTFRDFADFWLFEIIWAIQMPLFMFISGFFSTSSHPLSFKKGIQKLKTRAITYLVPFFTWFYLIRVLLLGAYSRDLWVASIALIHDVVSSFWYLWVVFILSVVIILSEIFAGMGKTRLGKHLRFIVSAGVLLLPWAVLCVSVSTSFLGCKYILYYSIFFGTGFLVRKHKKLLGKWIKKRWFSHLCFWSCLVVFCTIIATADVYQSSDTPESILVRILAGYSSIVVLGMLFIKAKPVISNKFQALVARLGQNTLEIYVVHIILYQYILLSPVYASQVGLIKAFLSFFVNAMVIAILCTGIILLLKTNRYTRFIFFGKAK